MRIILNYLSNHYGTMDFKPNWVIWAHLGSTDASTSRATPGGVDTVRTPGTADCGVSEGVIGRVVSHGKHEPAVPCGDLAEQFALNPFEVNDGKRAARFRGGENVPRASGNCDLYGLTTGLPSW